MEEYRNKQKMVYDGIELTDDEINFLIAEREHMGNEIQFSKRLQLRIVTYTLLLYGAVIGIIFKISTSSLIKISHCEAYILFFSSLVVLSGGVVLLIFCKASQDINIARQKEIRKISKIYTAIDAKLAHIEKTKNFLFEPVTKKDLSAFVIWAWIGILILGWCVVMWCISKIPLIECLKSQS
ncbi:hypothetical protein ACFL9U_16180 [Thermodesulfobacteriota bacterium]